MYWRPSANFKRDGRNAIDWFTTNVMQANPDKFNLILLSPSPVERPVLELCDGTTLISEVAVTVLGITIDDNLSFNEHISVWLNLANVCHALSPRTR